jgi:hypothetical protein
MSEEQGMIKRGKRPQRDFLVVMNTLARDARLSDRARGLLVRMLSYPDDWSFDSRWLAEGAKEGRDALRAALNELESAGYLVRERVRVNGRFDWDLTIYDSPRVSPVQPMDGFSGDGASTDATMAGFSGAGSPGPQNPASYEGLSRRTVTKEELPPLASLAGPRADALPGMPTHEPAPARRARPSPPVDENFEIFWKIYPRRTAKDAALKAWRKAVSRADAETIIEGARRYAADPNREAQFTAHPSSWLNGGRWSDDPLPDRTAPARPGGSSRLSVAMDVVRQLQEEEQGGIAPAIEAPGWTSGHLEQSWNGGR